MRHFTSVLPLAFAFGATAADTYDYIVAGAGAAGTIVAERLSAQGKQVLLIDRGQPSTFSSGGTWLTTYNDTLTFHDVPSLGLSIYSQFPNDPEGSPFCNDTADTAGCVLGGGTEVNMMAFVRPSDADFENWPAGWNGDDMTQARNNLYSRNPGTLTPSADGKYYDQAPFRFAKKFLDNVGWSEVNMLTDVNDKHNTYSHSAISVIGGQRAGPVRTYLPLALPRKNFDMMLGTNVVQVNRNGGHITGMTIEKDGKQSTVSLKKNGKAILASGVMSTPRILWYSGIGRGDQLGAIQQSNLGVTLPPQSSWINLPVGHSLRNHVSVRLNMQTSHEMHPFFGSDSYTSPTQQNVDQYNQGGAGILAQTNERMHFWTTNTLPNKSHKRYYQGIVLPEKNNVIQLQCVLSHGAKSTGILGLDTSTGKTVFTVAPELTAPGDRVAFANYVDMIINYSKKDGSPLKYKNGFTGAEMVQNHSGPGKHYVGTTKMGTDDGRQNGGTSVVDPNTKVYGTDNLFVVDASIHPDLPTGNTQAITMVAAEQAAMKILALD